MIEILGPYKAGGDRDGVDMNECVSGSITDDDGTNSEKEDIAHPWPRELLDVVVHKNNLR